MKKTSLVERFVDAAACIFAKKERYSGVIRAHFLDALKKKEWDRALRISQRIDAPTLHDRSVTFGKEKRAELLDYVSKSSDAELWSTLIAARTADARPFIGLRFLGEVFFKVLERNNLKIAGFLLRQKNEEGFSLITREMRIEAFAHIKDEKALLLLLHTKSADSAPPLGSHLDILLNNLLLNPDATLHFSSFIRLLSARQKFDGSYIFDRACLPSALSCAVQRDKIDIAERTLGAIDATVWESLSQQNLFVFLTTALETENPWALQRLPYLTKLDGSFVFNESSLCCVVDYALCKNKFALAERLLKMRDQNSSFRISAPSLAGLLRETIKNRFFESAAFLLGLKDEDGSPRIGQAERKAALDGAIENNEDTVVSFFVETADRPEDVFAYSLRKAMAESFLPLVSSLAPSQKDGCFLLKDDLLAETLLSLLHTGESRTFCQLLLVKDANGFPLVSREQLRAIKNRKNQSLFELALLRGERGIAEILLKKKAVTFSFALPTNPTSKTSRCQPVPGLES